MNKIIKRITALVLALVMALAVLPVTYAASLKLGSTGEEVRRLQKNLIGLGYLTGSATSTYDADTTDAVKAFQKDFGLSVDGNAGKATQTAVRNAVVRIQVEMDKMGYAPGTADGSYGAKTKTAVSAFQKKVGLKQTGIADEATRNAIDDRCGGLPVSAIKKGSSGTNVRRLQQALIGLGFLTGKVDGKYGSKTEAAVAAFQKAYGLSVDGNAGRRTMIALKNTVIALQSDLEQLGYESGTINGNFGQGTERAVYYYQRSKNLTMTGIAGPSTFQALYGKTMGGSDGVITSRYKIWIDPLYQSKDYSVIYCTYGPKKTTTVAKSGCGGVALAMVLNALQTKKVYTGVGVMQWLADNAYYKGEGTYQEGLYEYPKKQGLNATYCDSSKDLIAHLKKGHLAIALVKDKTGDAFFLNPTSRGHYIVVSGYRELNGQPQVFINNPIIGKDSRWFDIEDLMANVCNEDEQYSNSFVIIYK